MHPQQIGWIVPTRRPRQPVGCLVAMWGFVVGWPNLALGVSELGTVCITMSKTKKWLYLRLDGLKRHSKGLFCPRVFFFAGFHLLVVVLV